jgi:hypothetical protein
MKAVASSFSNDDATAAAGSADGWSSSRRTVIEHGHCTSSRPGCVCSFRTDTPHMHMFLLLHAHQQLALQQPTACVQSARGPVETALLGIWTCPTQLQPRKSVNWAVHYCPRPASTTVRRSAPQSSGRSPRSMCPPRPSKSSPTRRRKLVHQAAQAVAESAESAESAVWVWRAPTAQKKRPATHPIATAPTAAPAPVTAVPAAQLSPTTPMLCSVATVPPATTPPPAATAAVATRGGGGGVVRVHTRVLLCP